MKTKLVTQVLCGITIFSSQLAYSFMTPEQIERAMNDPREFRKQLPVESAFKSTGAKLSALKEVIPLSIQRKIDLERGNENKNNRDFSDLEFLGDLPKTIDLRAYDTPVKSQFGGTCTAFGLSAAMENLFTRRLGKKNADISERHFWSQYQQYSVYTAINTAHKNYITGEWLWPEKNETPYFGFDWLSYFKLTASTYLESDIDKAVSALSRGKPVYIGMSVPSDLANCSKVVRPETGVTDGGHAMAVVGYHLDKSISGGGYFVLKNSWSAKCGDSGYQYLPFSVCQKSKMYCVMWSIDQVTTKW